MAMTCSICKHKDRKQIDGELASGTSLRDIARQFRVGKDAVSRHSSCISEALAKARSDREAEIAYTVEQLLATEYKALSKLWDELDRQLTDPKDPSRYTLAIRACDVRIEWEERVPGVNGAADRWVNRRGTLQEALDLQFANGDERAVRRVAMSRENLTDLLLKLCDRLMNLVDLQARLEGRFRPVEKKFGQGNTIQLAAIQAVLINVGLLSPEGKAVGMSRLSNNGGGSVPSFELTRRTV